MLLDGGGVVPGAGFFLLIDSARGSRHCPQLHTKWGQLGAEAGLSVKAKCWDSKLQTISVLSEPSFQAGSRFPACSTFDKANQDLEPG